MSQVIVLGWDALDLELIDRFGLSKEFGSHASKVDTYINPTTDEPHTKELWPSLITGLHPKQHGIQVKTGNTDSVEWDNNSINTLSNIAEGIVPNTLRDRIGQKLRERGETIGTYQQPYYPKHGINTVFDGKDSRAISIPNYETEYDIQHNNDAHRVNVWPDLGVTPEEDFTPKKSVSEIYSVLGREYGDRVGQTIAEIQKGRDIVWTWFGLLDTVGHIAPAVDAPIVEDWYQTAAQTTQLIRDISPDATVIAVSDHGLQMGEHTHYSTIAANRSIQGVDSIYDVAPWIDDLEPDAEEKSTSVSQRGMADVTTQLEDLGYV